jgi:hypothetical protein
MLTLTAAALADVAPPYAGLLDPLYLLIAGGAVAGLVVLGVIAFFLFRGGGKKVVDPEAGLVENLARYAMPLKMGRHLLSLHGRPCRLRLVVLAPMGRRDLSEHGEPEALLNQVVRGLGGVAKVDKARLRQWPPQLSSTGFAPTFFRNTQRPRNHGQARHWVLLAGPAKAGDLPLLLGLAVWCEEAGEASQQSVQPHQWAELLRVEL